MMQNNISITLLVPHMTKERYSEATGLDLATIDVMLNDGRLSPFRHRLAKEGKREKVLINLVALSADAIRSYEESQASAAKVSKSIQRNSLKSTQ
ncbi:Hypothetical Protein PANA_3176 [Pantoea ananatis LMG 20103]|uniref:Uncharacterized protein n=1 Tax=Pantoea ananatis (strain LMG 20103) TaxID=706191 RepID=D4GM75_PANAM|nr:Hypothetical Protein PANA_3176 [Pantoea ananatis LMG 20103]